MTAFTHCNANEISYLLMGKLSLFVLYAIFKIHTSRSELVEVLEIRYGVRAVDHLYLCCENQ